MAKTINILSHWFFLILFFLVIGFIAFLSTQRVYLFDTTSTKRLSLSVAGQQVLQSFDQPLSIDIFVNPSDQIGERIAILMERFKRVKSDTKVRYLIPEEHPDLIREHNIRYPAEMLIRSNDRQQHITQPSEQAILNALIKLQSYSERWAVFSTGHGERDPLGDANFDLGQFSEGLAKRGIQTRALNLAEISELPDNTAVLVIASPQVNFLDNEKTLINRFVEKGGHLLVFVDPDDKADLDWLLSDLGIRFHKGVVVDGLGQQFNITQPDLIPFTNYPDHAITQDFTLTTLLANSLAIDPVMKKPYRFSPLLLTSDQSWTELSPLKDEVFYDRDQENLGPLPLAVSLTDITERQRIVVVGDGDFLSNRYLGNGGNLDFGIRLFSWLSDDDKNITIPFRQPSDLDFELSKTASAVISLGALFVLPGIFLLLAFLTYWRQKRR